MKINKIKNIKIDLSGSQESWFSKVGKDKRDHDILVYIDQFKLNRKNAIKYFEWSIKNQKMRVVEPLFIDGELKICDVGCGTGYIHKFFYKKSCNVKIIGVDIAKTGLQIARKLNENFGYDYVLADATNLPFKINHFNHLISLQLWQNFDEPKSILKEMIRVTKPNGSIVLSTTNFFHEMMFSPTTLVSFFLRKEHSVNSIVKIQEIFDQLNVPTKISHITFRPKQSYLKYIPDYFFSFVLKQCEYLEVYFNYLKLNKFLAVTIIDKWGK